MEKESFEDEKIAKILNENFISIKVDREERKDIDSVYMNVCQTMNGNGGWPLSIFMDSSKRPFFSGTYFPKNDSYRSIGFSSLLNKIVELWVNERYKLVESSERIINYLKSEDKFEMELSEQVLKDTYNAFKNNFDKKYGGFFNAPKFPSPHNLMFLLRYYYIYNEPSALNMVQKTLDSMYCGGIYDHVGFGFSRYSVDGKWLVPHFEKMLYDNALLSLVYVECYSITKNKKYKQIAEDIYTFIFREMTSPNGGFYSAQDADSEGVEGKYYVWTYDEIISILGSEKGAEVCKYYNVTSKGNFEGKNILNLIGVEVPEELEGKLRNSLKKLYSERIKRIHPHLDDKILTSWNSLMIISLVKAYRVFENNEYITSAERAMDFILKNLTDSNKNLYVSFRNERSSILGCSEDYGNLVWALIELYEGTQNEKYLEEAIYYNNKLIEYFYDEENSGIFLYGKNNEDLILKPKECYDGAMPSYNSVASLNFIRLSRLSSDFSLEEKAKGIYKYFGKQINSHGTSFTFSLIGFMYLLNGGNKLILTSENVDSLTPFINFVNSIFSPFTEIMVYTNENVSLKNIYPEINSYAIKSVPSTYICTNNVCSPVISDLTTFKEKFK